jgi:hypothetical protein
MKQKRRSVDQAVIADAIEGAVAPSSAIAVAMASPLVAERNSNRLLGQTDCHCVLLGQNTFFPCFARLRLPDLRSRSQSCWRNLPTLLRRRQPSRLLVQSLRLRESGIFNEAQFRFQL